MATPKKPPPKGKGGKPNPFVKKGDDKKPPAKKPAPKKK